MGLEECLGGRDQHEGFQPAAGLRRVDRGPELLQLRGADLGVRQGPPRVGRFADLAIHRAALDGGLKQLIMSGRGVEVDVLTGENQHGALPGVGTGRKERDGLVLQLLPGPAPGHLEGEAGGFFPEGCRGLLEQREQQQRDHEDSVITEERREVQPGEARNRNVQQR